MWYSSLCLVTLIRIKHYPISTWALSVFYLHPACALPASYLL